MTSRARYAALAAGTMILSLIGAAPAQAATTTQLATADSMVRGDQATATFGTNDTMRVDEGAPKISYVKFAAAPSGTVTDAQLKIYGTGNEAADFTVHKVASTWAEGTLNFSNRPPLGAQVGAGRFVSSGWTTVDVDAGVTAGQVTSLALVRTVTATDTVLSTRESTNDPQLVVTTGDVAPPPPAAACADGVDNDGDAKIDYPADPGCSSATDTDETDTVTPPPPGNVPPTVNAGVDQTITLPDNNAALDATVDDPDSAETVQWTGPAGVTFANATAVDTTATFPAAGTFDLRLTATDGVNPAVSDVVRVVVDPETTTPPPPAGDTIRSIALSRATLMSIPASGTQWNRLVTMANGTYTYSTLENNPEASGNIVAGALVCQRANVSATCSRVNAALDKFETQAPGQWSHAAFNREAVGIVQAGDIMGRNTTSWRNALASHIRGPHDNGGGSLYHTVLQEGALRLSNNHGRAAFQTYAAIVAALNLAPEASDLCASAKAWQGGTHSGWAFQATTKPAGRVMGWEGDLPAAASWYVSGALSGINPVTGDKKSGAVPGDIHRDGGVYPNPGPDGLDHYVWGAAFRQAAGDISLTGMGCNLFTYANDSLTRARVWMDTYAPDPSNFHAHGDNLMEYLDGREYSSAGGTTTAVGESVTVAASWIGPGSGNTWLR